MPTPSTKPKIRRLPGLAAPAASLPPTEAREVATQPDPLMVQAKRDIDRGLVDTDMRQTPGLDAAQRQRLVPTPTVPSDGHAECPSDSLPASRTPGR